MSHFVRAFSSTIALILTISFCQAEPKCDDAAVLESYAETIKCEEIASCATGVISGTSRDFAKMSDAELQQRAFENVARKVSQTSKSQPFLYGVANFIAGLEASMMIGWRNVFPTMKTGATAVGYAAKLAEGRDPTPMLAGMAKPAEMSISKCFNTKRVFHLQLTSGSRFIVNLDRSTMVPGCRSLILPNLPRSTTSIAPRKPSRLAMPTSMNASS